MALKRHYRCLDNLAVALAALQEGDQATAEEYMDKALEDEDELREALEDVNESQDEHLAATSDDETDEETEEDEADTDEETASSKKSRSIIKSKVIDFIQGVTARQKSFKGEVTEKTSLEELNHEQYELYDSLGGDFSCDIDVDSETVDAMKTVGGMIDYIFKHQNEIETASVRGVEQDRIRDNLASI